MPNPAVRSDNADQFSMFLSFTVSPLQWQYDSRLRRNIQLYATHDRQFAELCDRPDVDGLEQFFQNLALNETLPIQEWEPFNRKELAFKHLASYYDAIAYKAAKKLDEQYGKISEQKDFLTEAFCVARESLCNSQYLEKHLKTYRGDNNAKFSTYFQKVLMQKVKKEMDFGKYSRWRRFYKESQANLRKALKAGHTSGEIIRILWIRDYFKKVYNMNRLSSPMRERGKRWPEPEQEDFEETAKYCQAERFSPSTPIEVSSYSGEITANKIKQWFKACTKALNQEKKLEIPTDYLEISDTSDEEQVSEFTKPDTTFQNFGQSKKLNELFEKPLQERRDVEAIQLSDRLWWVDSDKVLLLHYGLGLTQKEIAARLQIKQSTISRRLSSYSKSLLKALNQVKPPESSMPTYISNWLSKHMSSPDRTDELQDGLISLVEQMEEFNKTLLCLHYGQGLDLSQLSQEMHLSELEIQQKLNEIDDSLSEKMGKLLESLKIKQIIKKWLRQYYTMPIFDALTQKFCDVRAEAQEILILRYQKKSTNDQIMQWLNIEAQQIEDLVTQGLCTLEEGLVAWMNEYLDLSIQGSEQEAIAHCVINWLHNCEQQI